MKIIRFFVGVYFLAATAFAEPPNDGELKIDWSTCATAPTLARGFPSFNTGHCRVTFKDNTGMLHQIFFARGVYEPNVCREKHIERSMLCVKDEDFKRNLTRMFRKKVFDEGPLRSIVVTHKEHPIPAGQNQ